MNEPATIQVPDTTMDPLTQENCLLRSRIETARILLCTMFHLPPSCDSLEQAVEAVCKERTPKP